MSVLTAMDDALSILECPNSRVPLRRSANGKLVSTDGRYEYEVQDDIMCFVNNISSVDPDDLRTRKVHEYYEKQGWEADENGLFADTKAFVDLRKASWQYTKKCMQRLDKYFKDGGHYILDAGSGAIPHDEVLKYGARFRRRVCIDFSAAALRIAKSKLGAKGIYLQADLTNIPIKTGSIDALTCNHVMYHIPAERQAAAFRELSRVLRPGGVGVVVYAWQRSPIARGLRQVGKLLIDARRSGEVVFDGRQSEEGVLPDLYYHSYSLDWFRAQTWPFRYRIDTFRIVDNEFMKKYISDTWLGRGILHNFFALQLLFPGFCGKYGAYPAIVIFKD